MFTVNDGEQMKETVFYHPIYDVLVVTKNPFVTENLVELGWIIIGDL